MPSINLKNNELDFTPTFGTQHFKIVPDVGRVIYCAAHSHLCKCGHPCIKLLDKKVFVLSLGI